VERRAPEALEDRLHALDRRGLAADHEDEHARLRAGRTAGERAFDEVPAGGREARADRATVAGAFVEGRRRVFRGGAPSASVATSRRRRASAARERDLAPLADLGRAVAARAPSPTTAPVRSSFVSNTET
jgi:hypothetical protein